MPFNPYVSYTHDILNPVPQENKLTTVSPGSSGMHQTSVAITQQRQRTQALLYSPMQVDRIASAPSQVQPFQSGMCTSFTSKPFHGMHVSFPSNPLQTCMHASFPSNPPMICMHHFHLSHSMVCMHHSYLSHPMVCMHGSFLSKRPHGMHASFPS